MSVLVLRITVAGDAEAERVADVLAEAVRTSGLDWVGVSFGVEEGPAPLRCQNSEQAAARVFAPREPLPPVTTDLTNNDFGI